VEYAKSSMATCRAALLEMGRRIFGWLLVGYIHNLYGIYMAFISSFYYIHHIYIYGIFINIPSGNQTWQLNTLYIKGGCQWETHLENPRDFRKKGDDDTPLYISGWWFGTWNLWLSIQLGMSSSQLTFTPSFFRGVGQPPTRYNIILHTSHFGDAKKFVVSFSKSSSLESGLAGKSWWPLVVVLVVTVKSSYCHGDFPILLG
jgi:hypothetical protein